jgi:ribonuclease J
LDIAQPVAGVLISHAHQDHAGLLEALPKDWPVYCGKATERLLQLGAALGNTSLRQTCFHWESGKAIAIGSFIITPYLIDHSAFDAYMLRVDIEGKTIVYTGDFRAHGRKAKLTEAIMRNPPEYVDALIMEGTNLTMDAAAKPAFTEAEIEEQFVRLFRECAGRVFVSWASTNIDRTVTLYRACKKSGRLLVLDLYCMLVLMRLKEFARLPQPEWEDGVMRAVVTPKMMRLMDRLGEFELIEYLKRHQAAMSARKLEQAQTAPGLVIMARGGLVDDYRRKGVRPTEKDTWAWSMWDGYLEDESTLSMREFFTPCQKICIHTSGHASPAVLKRFAENHAGKKGDSRTWRALGGI